MNPPNENREPTDNMELLKQQAAACGPGCGCHASGTPGKMRWVLGAIVLVAAGVMMARAVIKNNGASAETPVAGFTTMAIKDLTPAPVTNAIPATSDTIAVKEIGGLSELNAVATDMAGVFVFLPGKSETTAKALTAQIRGAAQTIGPKVRGKVGIFTLKTSSSDYERIAAQMSLPGVLALVKGRGMSAISGEITETRLVQAYVSASSAGGCGPSAGSGCCPKK
jgi:MYXO-CTERM domain-containing protein